MDISKLFFVSIVSVNKNAICFHGNSSVGLVLPKHTLAPHFMYGAYLSKSFTNNNHKEDTLLQTREPVCNLSIMHVEYWFMLAVVS